MATNNNVRSGSSVSLALFNKVYVPLISETMLQRHGGSYACYEKDRSTWRSYIPYSEKIEKEFILETKMFIRFMDKYVGQLAENPEVLQSFVSYVAEFLSKYTVKNPAFSGRDRAQAAADLTTQLWDNFGYIQTLLAQQAAKRAAKKREYKRKMLARKGRSAGQTESKESAAKASYEKVLTAKSDRFFRARGSNQK